MKGIDKIFKAIEDAMISNGPLLIMLVGLPASGKSTFADKLCDYMAISHFGYNSSNPSTDFRVIGTDRVIDAISNVTKLTYNELFSYKEIYRVAERAMHISLSNHLFAKYSVIWDQTNLTKNSRKLKLEKVPSDYYKIAVVIDEPKDLDFRLGNREGKNIPDEAIAYMKKSYEEPTLYEGFELVYRLSMQ